MLIPLAVPLVLEKVTSNQRSGLDISIDISAYKLNGQLMWHAVVLVIDLEPI